MSVLNLPPGLSDRNIELWVEGDVVFVLKDGLKRRLENVDDTTMAIFMEDLQNSVLAQKALYDMNILEPMERLKKYLSCRYGDFNMVPDFTPEGANEGDFYDCGQRGNCKWEGKLCSRMKAPNGILTRREIEIIRLIAEDLPDKQIAEILGIEITTMATHRKHIEEKLGVFTKVGIAAWALKNNIV